jgi:hypothetical protein
MRFNDRENNYNADVHAMQIPHNTYKLPSFWRPTHEHVFSALLQTDIYVLDTE